MSSKPGIRDRIFGTLAKIVHRLSWVIIIAGIFLAGASIYIALEGAPALGIHKLGLSGNPNDLLSSKESYHRKYLEYTHDFKAEEDYVIVIEGNDFEENKDCVEFLAKKLKENELFKNIFYKLDLGQMAEERGLLFLETDQLKNIEKQIGEFTALLGKDSFTLDLNSLLAVASTKFDPKYMRKSENEEALDEFAQEFTSSLSALADRLEGKVKPNKKAAKFGNFMAKNSELGKLQNEAALHEYLTLKEGKILLIQIPSPNQEASFGDHGAVIKPIQAAIKEARAEFPKLEIGLTGEPALSEDQANATQHDSMLSSVVTFALIALLFLVSFREFTRPALALLTLVLAVCWTIGFTTIVIGRFNILSLAFIPMILGLGIDFGIQILGRYEEELPKSTDVLGALSPTLIHTGNAILTGASTTAAAFYTMCFNQFTGLAEMGIIGGTGIVFCLLGNLLLLPALLNIRDRRMIGKPHAAAPTPQAQPNHKNLFDRIVLDHAGAIVLLATVATVLAAFQLKKIWFDYNLLNLQNPNLESVRFEHKLVKGERSVMFAADICENLKEAAEHVKQYSKLDTVSEAISLTSVIPEGQEPKLKIIKQIKKKLEAVKVPKSGVKVNVEENIRVLQTLRANCDNMNKLAQTWAAADQKKEAQEFFGSLISVMDRCLKVLGSMSQKEAEEILTSYQTQVFGELRKNLQQLKGQKVDRPINEEDIPKDIKDRFVGKSGKILVQIYPKKDIWERKPLEDFVNEIRTVNPDVTGTPVQNYEYVMLLKKSFQQAGLIALGTIVILITLHFLSLNLSSLKYVIPTLLPLGLGIIWTAGLMPVLHLSFNPANIMTLPLLIGIGVAFGVYAVDRYRENSSPALFSTSTGKAILLSALTTMFGFGTLGFSGFGKYTFVSDPSLLSLGRLMTVGVVMCLISSLYVCPALLQLLGRRKIQVDADKKS